MLTLLGTVATAGARPVTGVVAVAVDAGAELA
jgi:hypothetical protein